MKVNVVKTFNIELSEEEVRSFLDMMNDMHECRTYDATVLYKLEEVLGSIVE